MLTRTTIKKNIYGEFRVRLFVNGIYQTNCDYFTDDKQDAINTAEQMEDRALTAIAETSFNHY